MVTTAPVLACPDPEQQFFLEVDASSFALGAVCRKVWKPKVIYSDEIPLCSTSDWMLIQRGARGVSQTLNARSHAQAQG